VDEAQFGIAWPFLIPIVAIIGGITIAIVNSMNRARVRELQIKERIAMIEKGMVPPPEVDPVGFERAMSDGLPWRRPDYPGRFRRVGIILMGVGFGVMFLLGFATGEPRRGIGVGGFLLILGLAFILNGIIDARLRRQTGSVPPAARP
jgi:hypothetical protein